MLKISDMSFFNFFAPRPPLKDGAPPRHHPFAGGWIFETAQTPPGPRKLGAFGLQSLHPSLKPWQHMTSSCENQKSWFWGIVNLLLRTALPLGLRPPLAFAQGVGFWDITPKRRRARFWAFGHRLAQSLSLPRSSHPFFFFLPLPKVLPSVFTSLFLQQ